MAVSPTAGIVAFEDAVLDVADSLWLQSVRVDLLGVNHDLVGVDGIFLGIYLLL